MTARQIRRTSLIVGVVLILVGILVPADTLIESLRAEPGDLLDQLLVGATLFKISLVVLGMVVVVLGRLSVWERKFATRIDRNDSRQNKTGPLNERAASIRLRRLTQPRQREQGGEAGYGGAAEGGWAAGVVG